MRDINFFSEYQSARKANKTFQVLIGFGLTLVIGVSVMIYGYQHLELEKINLEIAKHQEFLKDEKNKKMYDEYAALNFKVTVMNEYIKVIDEISTKMNKSGNIDSIILKKISASMPVDCLIQTLAVDSADVSFQASSRGVESVAELEHNLKQDELFENVHVLNITAPEEGGKEFIFSVTFNIKDVSNDETEQ